MIQAIHWDVTPEIIDGWSTPNYYGLLFVTGLIIGYFVVRKMFRKENVPDEKLDTLVLYMVLATIIGARLGHVLFYGPYWDYVDATGQFHPGYFSNPWDIVKVWEGGLASHGGGFAILLALWIYSRRVSKKPYLWILDRIAAPVAVAGIFIRLGNLVNSEIVGKITDVPWGFKFMHYDCPSDFDCPWEVITVRHPAQLYEAIAYAIIFAVLMHMYWKRHAWKHQGRVFGAFLVLLFGARFIIEFFKIAQSDGREEWLLNTGQLLSIPFVLVGIYLFWRSFKPQAYMAGINPEIASEDASDEKKSGENK